MKKYLFQYVFLIIFVIGSVYSPMAYAGSVVKSVVNSIEAAVLAVVYFNVYSLVIGTLVDPNYIENQSSTVDCLWKKSDTFGGGCGGSNGAGAVSIGVSDSAACAGTASLTFYNDVAPHSANEALSNLEIYRFTLPSDATYWPWGNYSTSLEGQKNAAVINWVSGADQLVGNGLFNNYDFKGDSYFLSAPNIITKSEQTANIATAQQAIADYNAAKLLDQDYDYYGTIIAQLNANLAAANNPSLVVSEPYATVKYADVCDANGVCNIFDQSIPKDLYAAYIAKTDATYEMPITYDDKVIFNASADCPAGTKINSDGSCTGQQWVSGGWTGYQNIPVPNIASIHYNDGRIAATSEMQSNGYQSYPTGKYYITDAAGNKTFLNGPISYYGSTIKNLTFEIKEKDKPYNFDVEYPIQAACGTGFTLTAEGECRGYATSGWNWGNMITVDPNYRMHYNGGYVPVTPETAQYGNQSYPTGKYYITDIAGNKFFAAASTYSSGVTCPTGYTWSGSYCYNYSANPYRVDPDYYLASSIKLNDAKMTAGLNVIHDFKYSCNGTDTLQDGRCRGYGNWGGWYGWGSYSPSSSIKYGGVNIPVTAETAQYGNQSYPTGKYYITDAAGTKYVGDSNGIMIPDGVPTAPKLTIDYPLLVDSSYNNQTGYSYSNFRLGNYNGGTYYPSILPIDRATDNAFYIAGTKYSYISSMKTLKLTLDRYTAPPSGTTLIRRGKFLSTASGQKVTNTTNSLPTGGLNTGNGILGPFRPITDALCFPPPTAPTVTQQSCTSITLQSDNAKILGVSRRIKDSNTAFSRISDFDFSASSVFTDTNLTPHTNYEYVLEDINQIEAPQIPTSPVTAAYTACLPSCTISNATSIIPKYGSLDLEWECAADTVAISCQIQSTDSELGTRTGLNSSGSIKISPEIDSQYSLSCTNIDGAVTQPPVEITVFVPSIKEVKPQ